jgi:hypothetical protein
MSYSLIEGHCCWCRCFGMFGRFACRSTAPAAKDSALDDFGQELSTGHPTQPSAPKVYADILLTINTTGTNRQHNKVSLRYIAVVDVY